MKQECFIVNVKQTTKDLHQTQSRAHKMPYSLKFYIRDTTLKIDCK